MQITEHRFSTKTNIRSSFNKRRNAKDLYVHISKLYHEEVDKKFKDKQALSVMLTTAQHGKRIMAFVGRIVKVHSKRDGKIYYIKVPSSLEELIEKSMYERESIKMTLDVY